MVDFSVLFGRAPVYNLPPLCCAGMHGHLPSGFSSIIPLSEFSCRNCNLTGTFPHDFCRHVPVYTQAMGGLLINIAQNGLVGELRLEACHYLRFIDASVRCCLLLPWCAAACCCLGALLPECAAACCCLSSASGLVFAYGKASSGLS